MKEKGFKIFSKIGAILLTLFYILLVYILGLKDLMFVGLEFSWSLLIAVTLVIVIPGIFIVPGLIALWHYGFIKDKNVKETKFGSKQKPKTKQKVKPTKGDYWELGEEDELE